MRPFEGWVFLKLGFVTLLLIRLFRHLAVKRDDAS
jgi:hypothetical protein